MTLMRVDAPSLNFFLKGNFSPVAEERGRHLMCFVRNRDAHQNECMIIDEQTLDAGPSATIVMPSGVPRGFYAGKVSVQ